MSTNANSNTTTDPRPALHISLQNLIKTLDYHGCPYSIEEARGDGTDFQHAIFAADKGYHLARRLSGWLGISRKAR